MTFQQLKTRSNQFVANLDSHCANVVKDSSEKIIQLNREQMEEGITSKDVGIYPHYRSKYYAFKKANMGSKAPFGVPDLKLTGSFHEKMTLKVSKKEYFLSSRDKKTSALEDNYPDIFGLTDTNKEEAQAITGKLLAEKYKLLVLK